MVFLCMLSGAADPFINNSVVQPTGTESALNRGFQILEKPVDLRTHIELYYNS
jgi:hypothetical protein